MGRTQLGPELFETIDWRCIGPHRGGRVMAVAGDPSHAQTFYFGACAGGVRKTTDGGASREHVLHRNAETGAIDLVIDPTNPRVLYAALWQVIRRPWILESGGPGSGIFKSTDCGDPWSTIYNQPTPKRERRTGRSTPDNEGPPVIA